MAGLYWMTLTLVFFLSAGNTLAVSRLEEIVEGIYNKYKTNGMFSLAVTVPDSGQTIKDLLQQIDNSDPREDVQNKINTGDVYVGNRVVAAKPYQYQNGKGTEHAESRVVDNLSHLRNNRNFNDMLLFYVYASPCVDKCSNQNHRDNILERIKVINQWKSRAFVFSKIFTPSSGYITPVQERCNALMQLGNSIGRNNIFRCDKENNMRKCTSCFSGTQVVSYCVSDDNNAKCEG
ncbi:hypothetical protein PAMA_016805 [Pampus argenteus]